MQQLVGTVDSDEVTTVHIHHRNQASPPKQSDRDRNPFLSRNFSILKNWYQLHHSLDYTIRLFGNYGCRGC